MAVKTILTGAQVHGHIVNDTLALAHVFCTPVGAIRLWGGAASCGGGGESRLALCF